MSGETLKKAARARRKNVRGQFIKPRLRTGQQSAPAVPAVKGEYDPMSFFAAQSGIDLCRAGSASGRCSRAVGHDEAARDAAGEHVVTDDQFRIVAFWTLDPGQEAV